MKSLKRNKVVFRHPLRLSLSLKLLWEPSSLGRSVKHRGKKKNEAQTVSTKKKKNSNNNKEKEKKKRRV